MSIRVIAYTVELGSQQELDVAIGEDRKFALTYTVGGVPIDFTGYSSIALTVKSPVNGIALFTKPNAGFIGAPSAGTPSFVFAAADTALVSPAVFEVDVSAVDAAGWKTQLQLASRFTVLLS